MQLTTDAVVPVVTAWCMVFVGAAAVWVVARRAGWSREVTGALLLVVPLAIPAFLDFLPWRRCWAPMRYRPPCSTTNWGPSWR
nr:hypothetical protein [Candidatus Microthrix sp.]